MLAADAASTSQLRAGERVLYGGWGRTHTLRAGRPPSPVMGAAACTPPRLNVGVSHRKPPRAPVSVLRDRRALRAGRSPSHRVASCAALRQRRTSRPLPWPAVPEPSCGWGRTGAWTAPRCSRLPRPIGDPAGAACTDGSAPAPARLTVGLRHTGSLTTRLASHVGKSKSWAHRRLRQSLEDIGFPPFEFQGTPPVAQRGSTRRVLARHH